ncbi:hypothetical protein O181_029973 [Austropuccinia psidii MF-1]|uniref:AB hydrolase-1 domain-containing protein n=1 Tax=Austropuccinia psidii MF-1 TaxID=1389203 RepID=A0A9Q3CWT8_9BASI|nr:hypothetical protein [Austropuccinia psidii MF-1]
MKFQGKSFKTSFLLALVPLTFSTVISSSVSLDIPSVRRSLSAISPINLIKGGSGLGITFDNGYKYDVTASPKGPLPPRTSGDAPWTQAESSYRIMISCPGGIKNKPKGIVLLVPGTGTNGSESYKSTPFYQGLPSLGFDLCWIDLPNYSMSDMQLSAEFIAYAVKFLAPKSRGGKLNIISYSQGGPDVQWASTFWPSIQGLVTGFIAVAPSMKGSDSTNLLCVLSVATGGCLPSVLQQLSTSNFMKAATSLKDTRSPAYALLPTTIIYSRSDEIVTPQVGPNASSRLLGASNIAIQDICGAAHLVGHFGIMGDMGVYAIALDALLKGRPANQTTVDRSYCNKSASSLGFQLGNLENDLKEAFRTGVGGERGDMLASELRTLRIPAEPYLQKYVCDRGVLRRQAVHSHINLLIIQLCKWQCSVCGSLIVYNRLLQ